MTGQESCDLATEQVAVAHELGAAPFVADTVDHVIDTSFDEVMRLIEMMSTD